LTCVLDASALLVLLLDEPGGDVVRAELVDAAMSTVNLAEVVAHYARNGASPADIAEVLNPLPFARIPLDSELAFDCGLMLPATRAAGLSLGDRACLALARRLACRALTADQAWAAISEAVGIEVEVLR
jgi:ribonuclease VapC